LTIGSNDSNDSLGADDGERPGADSRQGVKLSPAEAARLARVFGDVLPDTTRDERDNETSGESPSGGAGSGNFHEEWLRSEVPPHHG